MGLSTRDRISLNRRRFNLRKILSIKNAIILSVILVIVFVTTSAITAYALKEKVASSTVVYKGEVDNKEVEIDNKESNVENNVSNEESIPVSTTEDESLEKDIQTENVVKEENVNSNISLTLLGEIMMGGAVSQNLKYNYSDAVRDIYSSTRTSNFTYANFSTNITNLDKIENAKSKYLVTKEATNMLNALGLDAVSIASDHIIDYDKDILNSTINLIEKADIFVAGRKDIPVYFEKGNKKIAIVSTNSVIVGTSKNYTNNDISIYSRDNLKKNIKEAKEVADIVIADVHWGRDHSYGVTEQMKQIAKGAIDDGADMVIGSHALGVYPIVTYKDKPIIYSTGYLMTDLDYNVAKEGFIFNLNIDADGKITELEMVPTYIEDKKAVKLMQDYDINKCTSYLTQFNNWHLENGLNSKIENNKIIIDF